MCEGGPPKPTQPMRPHSRTTVANPTSFGAGRDAATPRRYSSSRSALSRRNAVTWRSDSPASRSSL